jgi:phosphatidate cytidylyltransferase
VTESSHQENRQPAGIQTQSLLVRVATAVLYGLVVIGAVLLGPLATAIVFGLMAGAAATEFYAMQRRETRLPNEFLGVLGAGVLPLAAAFWGMPGLSATLTALIAASLVWHTAVRRTRTEDTAITVFGSIYTGFLLAYLVLILRTFEAGTYLALLVVFSVWINDVLAYFIGSLFGRHRLAPAISPKKSWEGFFAGAVGTIGAWYAASLVPTFGLTGTQAILAGAAVGVGAVVGDLAESRMKREAGVKDSGTWLPGHGGFLDRLDSLIMVSLIAYWVLWWTGVATL